MKGKPYDAASKALLELDPVGWAAFVGVVRPPDLIRRTDSDLSTVTAAADKVIRVADPEPWILDIEFQSWCDPSLPRQLLKYNALLQDGHKRPVASVLVVLDPAAYSGRHAVHPLFGPAWEFCCTVLRVWEASAEALLAGPLAPVADVPIEAVPEVIRRLSDRASHEADPDTTARLLTAIGLLLRLRYGPVTAQSLLQQFPEILDMEPFKTATDKGRAAGLRDSILRLGRKKFGPPTAEQEAALTALTDLPRLEALTEKLLDVNTWDELLAGA